MKQQPVQQRDQDEIIVGRNPVLEALKGNREIEALYIQMRQEKTVLSGSLKTIIAKAKQKGILLKYVVPEKLRCLSGGTAHQGVVAICSAVQYATLDDLFQRASSMNQQPFFVLCDGLQDPHNLGAIIRTAEAAGAHGVILPKRRSIGVNQTVYKTSAGAASVLPICRVSNLNQTLTVLKQKGIWVYCSDMNGTAWHEPKYAGGIALIMGSEGEGVSNLLKKQADFCIGLPMYGQLNSLNVSVSAGIIMYEISKKRMVSSSI